MHNPKHDVGLILCGTQETGNNLNDTMGEGEYTNVTTDRQLSQIELSFFRDVQQLQANPEPTEKGDMLDGLIVGLDMLCRFCGTRKIRKRIFLITDGEKEAKYNSEEFDQVAKTISENDVKLNCITLDFCNDLAEDDSDEEEEREGPDVSMENKETGESEAQLKNKEFLLNLQEQTGCAIIPAETAIELYQ